MAKIITVYSLGCSPLLSFLHRLLILVGEGETLVRSLVVIKVSVEMRISVSRCLGVKRERRINTF